MKLEQPILPDWMHGTCKRKNWTKEKIKRNETKEHDWFWSLDNNHVLYPVLYTPTSLPMMPRPGTQAALVVSRADKIVTSALFATSLVRNNIFSNGVLPLSETCAVDGFSRHWGWVFYIKIFLSSFLPSDSPIHDPMSDSFVLVVRNCGWQDPAETIQMDPVSPILRQLKWPPWNNICIIAIQLLHLNVWMALLRGIYPISLLSVHRFQHETLETPSFNIPLFKTAIGQRTFYYRMVSFWNALPQQIKLSQSLAHFKTLMKKRL